MQTILRPYHPADEASVIALWKRCGLVRPVNDPAKDIQRKRAVGGELFLVAEREGKLLGTVMAGYDGHRGWLNYVGVDPEARLKGLGRLLVEEAEARLRALGCPKVNLQVLSDNGEVKAFYQKLGYSVDPVVSFGKRLIQD